MLCEYCGKELSDKYFYKVVSKGKTYYRKKCSFCISDQKQKYYQKKKEEAQNGR